MNMKDLAELKRLLRLFDEEYFKGNDHVDDILSDIDEFAMDNNECEECELYDPRPDECLQCQDEEVGQE